MYAGTAVVTGTWLALVGLLMAVLAYWPQNSPGRGEPACSIRPGLQRVLPRIVGAGAVAVLIEDQAGSKATKGRARAGSHPGASLPAVRMISVGRIRRRFRARRHRPERHQIGLHLRPLLRILFLL